MTNISVILVSGGEPEHSVGRSVELIHTNGTQLCSLPSLPSYRRHHTQNGVTSCGSYDSPARFSCHTLSSSGSWEQSHSLSSQGRRFHSAWASAQGIILFGGGEGKATTEILTEDGNTTPGFPLNYDTL